MADIAISLLIRSLRVFETFIQQNLHLLLGVQANFEDVRMQMEHIQAFLTASDSREDNDPQFDVLVNQVWKLAYQTEDAIDEFLHHLAHHEHESCVCLKHISCILKVKARHRIASDINSIKSKVVQIHEAYRMFNGGNIGNPITAGDSQSPLHSHPHPLERHQVLGIDQPLKDIISKLVEGSPWPVVIPVFGTALGWWGKSSSRSVISVMGMLGSGKTTLVRQVYNDSAVKRNFKIQVWIKVSQSFKVERILTDIVQQIYTAIKQPVPGDIINMESDELRLRIQKLLLRKKYLIVLDNVCHTDVWVNIRDAVPNNNYGSRVIITTWIHDVATSADGVFEMEALSGENCWILFCRKTFQDGTCPDQLEDICRSIVARLDGLPLAVEVVSSILATRDVDMIDEWRLISENLRHEMGNNRGLDAAKKAISFSFKDLPYHLKSCLLYLTIFPEDHAIECARVVRLWIAQGFVIVSEGNRRTPEEVAEDYLRELQKRSLIKRSETTTDGRVKTCRINNLVREFIVDKSRKQNFTTIVTRDDNWPDNSRHVSVIDNFHDGRERMVTTKLRSFLTFNVVHPINDFSNAGFRLLNVLDLKGTKGLVVFPDDVVKLFHLKYLSFRDTGIREIPRSIKKLGYLETLDLKGTFVTQLPLEIQELRNLRHLLVYRYEFRDYPRFSSKFGFNTSADIGRLESLQKLCFIEAEQGSNHLMKMLGSLSQLRRLGIINFRREHEEALCCSLENLTRLRVLSVTSAENEIIDLSALPSARQHLQRLYLKGCLQNLPEWIPLIPNLVKLVLKSSNLEDDPLIAIQCLTRLVHLEFQQAFQGENMHFRTDGFKRLKVLGLYELNRLRSVVIEERAMPCLEILTLYGCKRMLNAPHGMEHLPKLERLEYLDMPREFVPPLYLGVEVGNGMNNFKQPNSCVFFILGLIVLFVVGVFIRL